MKTYEVGCNWSQIIESENPEEAERKFWEIFDNSFLKADVKEFKKGKSEEVTITLKRKIFEHPDFNKNLLNLVAKIDDKIK